MAQLQTTRNPDTARSDRRRLALVAYLKRERVTSLDQIDRDNPLIRSATIGELEEAFSIVGRALSTRIEQVIRRMMGNDSVKAFGFSPPVPLEEARFMNLDICSAISGMSFLLYNQIDVFKVIFSSSAPRVVFVQSCIHGSKGSYYLLDRRSSKMVETPKEPLSTSKPLTASITSRIVEIVSRSVLVSPPPEEKPMINQIRSNLGYQQLP